MKSSISKQFPSTLFIGPLTPPVNGQSVAFTTAYNGYPGTKSAVDTSTSGSTVHRTIQYGFSLFHTLWTTATTSCEVVYFTCSRTYKGSLRDILLVSLAHLRGKRVVNHLHGADLKRFYRSAKPIWRWLLRKTYSQIDNTIILLPEMQQEFEGWADGMNTTVVANCYPPELDKQNGDSSIVSVQYRLVYLSNLMYSKGIIDLLEAFRHLKQLFPDLQLDIAGKPLADEYYNLEGIKEVLSKYDEDPGVNFLGGVYGAAKADLLRQADIFVLPTFYRSEALPISIIEAMRSGCAIITTKHNYLSYFLQKDMGLLVSVKTPDKIVESIAYFYGSLATLSQAKKHNENFAKNNFTNDKYVNGVSKVISDL